jgi:hypothetical protein
MALMETTTTATTIDLGNNESASIGIFAERDGTFLALTLSSSRTFKTRLGAERWLAKIGYAPNGSRLRTSAADTVAKVAS